MRRMAGVHNMLRAVFPLSRSWEMAHWAHWNDEWVWLFVSDGVDKATAMGVAWFARNAEQALSIRQHVVIGLGNYLYAPRRTGGVLRARGCYMRGNTFPQRFIGISAVTPDGESDAYDACITLSHELVHYEQHRDGRRLTERGVAVRSRTIFRLVTTFQERAQ